jgi:HAD superfamily hydrolase (TIGR01490 family)
MIAAIFDLDGTLYTGHIGEGISRHHRLHKVNRFPLAVYMVAHTPMWLMHRAGLVSDRVMRQQSIGHMGWTVRGWTVQEAAAAFAWIAEHYVQPLISPPVMSRLRDHQSAGHRVVIVSGTLAPLLAEIGRKLGVPETVGTPLVVRNGRYTGASERPVCQGASKVARLEDYLREDESISWTESYAYADSYSDVPLLQAVGHPVAVHPDARLAAHASQQGWDVLS